MLKKHSHELKLRSGRDPKPTVEVSADSLSSMNLDLTEILSPVLNKFAKSHPKERATISLYGSQSLNFPEAGWSEFVIVDGSEALLSALGRAFATHAGVKSRFSDYVRPSAGQSIFHLEEGRCWQVEDALTWFSVDDEQVKEEKADETSASDENELGDSNLHLRGDEDWPDIDFDDDSEVDSEDGFDVELDSGVPGVAPRRGRVRAARSDASVRSIKKTIERIFGLPEGSVSLCGPDGKPIRANATIRTLRNRWEKS